MEMDFIGNFVRIKQMKKTRSYHGGGFKVRQHLSSRAKIVLSLVFLGR